MAKEFFKNLPDTSTPLNASRLNGLLNGNEAMGNIVVGDVRCKNLWNNGETLPADRNSDVKLNNPLPAGTYTLSWEYMETTSTDTPYLKLMNNDGTVIRSVYLPLNNNYVTFTIGSEISQYRFYPSKDYATSEGVSTVVNKVQIEEGTTATEYTPHKNFENLDWKQAIENKDNGTFTIPIRWDDLKEISFRTLGSDLATFAYVTIPKEQWHNNGNYQVQTICFDTSGYYQGYANYKVSKKEIDHFIIHVTGTYTGAQIYYK